MAKLLQTIIPILFLFLFLFLAAAATTVWSLAPPSSTFFFYNFRNSTDATDLTFQGEARIIHQLGGNHIRLTDAKNESVGRVLYPHHVPFWRAGGRQIDFETTFSFTILPSPDISPADGIVFFIAPIGSKPPNGATGGNLGVFDSSGYSPGVFAVEFDTYVDEWDPDYRHVGIDIGSRVSRFTTSVGDAILDKEVTATIRYAAVTKVISVSVSAGSETFGASYEYDLSSFLPKQVQIGLSASTGENAAVHEILSWNFTSTMINTGPPNKLIRQFV